VTFTQNGRTMNVFANLQGLTDAPTALVVTSTVGNETVACNEAAGKATCTGNLIGDPAIGGIVDLANNGKILSKGTIASTRPLTVTGITFDTQASHRGSTYLSTISGSNLTAQTYFDIRFTAPGSSANSIAPNWQTGPGVLQSVPAATPTGTWTITGVRAHQDPADHAGSFVLVSTPITIQ